MRRKYFAVAAVVLLAFASGCAGTSKAFQMSVGSSLGVAHRISVEEAAYVKADQSLSADESQKRMAAAAALDQSALATEAITVDATETAWRAVKPNYLAYVDSDANIRPDTKAVRRNNASALDALIQHERQRHFWATPSAPPSAPPSR